MLWWAMPGILVRVNEFSLENFSYCPKALLPHTYALHRHHRPIEGQSRTVSGAVSHQPSAWARWQLASQLAARCGLTPFAAMRQLPVARQAVLAL